MRDKKYEKPPLSDHQLEIFKQYHQMDYILYELSLAKFERQVASFGQDRMENEVAKLKMYAEKCKKKPSNCYKSKFTTVRNSPNSDKAMKLTHFKGEKIGKKIDRDYGKFLNSGSTFISIYKLTDEQFLNIIFNLSG